MYGIPSSFSPLPQLPILLSRYSRVNYRLRYFTVKLKNVFFVKQHTGNRKGRISLWNSTQETGRDEFPCKTVYRKQKGKYFFFKIAYKKRKGWISLWNSFQETERDGFLCETAYRKQIIKDFFVKQHIGNRKERISFQNSLQETEKDGFTDFFIKQLIGSRKERFFLWNSCFAINPVGIKCPSFIK